MCASAVKIFLNFPPHINFSVHVENTQRATLASININKNMECVKIFIVLFLIFLFKYSTNSDVTSDEKAAEEMVLQNAIRDKSHLYKKPSIMIVTLVRNKAHTLPLFLTYLEEQEYPKSRISLWFVTDHNEDNSREILETWLAKVRSSYHSIRYQFDESGEKMRKSETNFTHWSNERFEDIIRMKEEALDYARRSWADYVLVGLINCYKNSKLKHNFHSF